jgi:DNA-binding MarR family transcriptional regulator
VRRTRFAGAPPRCDQLTSAPLQGFPALVVPDPASPLAVCIVAARQSLRHAISAHARRFRLTSQQFWAIVSLRRTPGLTPKELAEAMLLDAPAASRLVASLVTRKYVVLQPDRSDRRRVRIHLTESGARLGESLAEVEAEYRAAVERGLSDDERSALCAGLRRVMENLAGFRGTDIAGRRGRVARTA